MNFLIDWSIIPELADFEAIASSLSGRTRLLIAEHTDF
jgi:hypothetical protein